MDLFKLITEPSDYVDIYIETKDYKQITLVIIGDNYINKMKNISKIPNNNITFEVVSVGNTILQKSEYKYITWIIKCCKLNPLYKQLENHYSKHKIL